jgi:hypothetical protein
MTSRSIGLLLVAAVAVMGGCSEGGGSPGTSPGSSSSNISPSPQSSAAIEAEIRSNWQTFFEGNTSADQKAAVLQNGTAFLPIIRAQADTALAKSVSVTISGVQIISATTALVSYTILLNDKPALNNVKGEAVLESGTWKVTTGSFCGLLGLEGVKTPLCSAPGATGSPTP